MTNECFIIGSGSSLLNLTDDEKMYLNNHPNTMGMNKYLIFHDLLNIVPKYMFLGDYHFPAHKVFKETIEVAKNRYPDIKFYVDRYYYNIFVNQLSNILFNLKERLILLIKYFYFAELTIKYENLLYFKAQRKYLNRFFWGKSLEDELFFHKGSLTTAINLANILFPGCNIKLIGVDLNNPYYFFEQILEKRKDLFDPITHIKSRETGKFFPVIRTNAGSIVDYIPDIVNELKSQNINLYCCNKESLLIEENLCEYSPII